MAGYFNIIIVVEWISFFAAIYLLKKGTGAWLLFIAWLFITIIAEFAGWYIRAHLENPRNALPFNLLMLVRILFFVYILASAEMLAPVKKKLYVFAILFITGGLLNLFFYQGLHVYNSFTESVADIVLAVTCCYLLFVLLKDDQQLHLMKQEYFWLANGLIFYLLGSAMLFNFSYLLLDYYKRTGINLGTYINTSLNLVLHTNLIIAFICRRKTCK